LRNDMNPHAMSHAGAQNLIVGRNRPF